MNKITFSYNWNGKLDNTCFTTLRLSGRHNVGDVLEIWHKDKLIGAGRILDKKRLANLDQINDWVAYLDTGYNAEECRNIIKRMHRDIRDWSVQPIYYYLITVKR